MGVTNPSFGIKGLSASGGIVTNGTVSFANSNGISFGVNGQIVTGMVETNYAGQGFTSTTTAGTEIKATNNSDGLSMAVPAYLTAAAGGGITNIRLSAGTTSNLASAFTFDNGGGVSFGLNAGTITATVATNYLTSQSNQALSGSNGSFTFQTATFGSSNGLYFYTTNGSMVGSYTVPSIPGATVFSNSNNVSFGLNGSTITATATFAAGGGFAAQGSGAYTQNTGTIAFVNSNGITFGLSTNQMTASHDGLTTAALSNHSHGNPTLNLTNLSGTTASASNGFTLSLSAAAPGGGAGVTLSQWPIYYNGLASSSAYTATTATTAGGTRTAYSLYVAPYPVPFALSYNKINFLLSHATVVGTGSATNAQMFGFYTNNAGTLSLVSTLHFQLHMSQSSVTARSYRWFWGTNSTSNSSSTAGNISASIARLNNVLLDNGGATSLAASHYFLAYMQTHRTSGGLGGGSFSAYFVSESQTTLGSMFGTNVSSKPWSPFIGIVSGTVSSAAANVNIMPASIHSTAITGTGGSSQNRLPWIAFGSN